MSRVKCPYCGREQSIDPDDGEGYGTDIMHTEVCICGKKFGYTVVIAFDYDVFKIDCVNELIEHDFQLARILPVEFSKMKCTICGRTRELNDDERKKFRIGSKESFFKKLKNG
jgi:uncharacterized protein YlaI